MGQLQQWGRGDKGVLLQGVALLRTEGVQIASHLRLCIWEGCLWFRVSPPAWAPGPWVCVLWDGPKP